MVQGWHQCHPGWHEGQGLLLRRLHGAQGRYQQPGVHLGLDVSRVVDVGCCVAQTPAVHPASRSDSSHATLISMPSSTSFTAVSYLGSDLGAITCVQARGQPIGVVSLGHQIHKAATRAQSCVCYNRHKGCCSGCTQAAQQGLTAAQGAGRAGWTSGTIVPLGRTLGRMDGWARGQSWMHAQGLHHAHAGPARTWAAVPQKQRASPCREPRQEPDRPLLSMIVLQAELSFTHIKRVPRSRM